MSHCQSTGAPEWTLAGRRDTDEAFDAHCVADGCVMAGREATEDAPPSCQTHM